MPVPFEYSNAGAQFRQLLRDARDLAGFATTNQSYTMVQGVLLTFRRRLTTHEALRFADVLPAVARAIFVADWDIDSPPQPFVDRATMSREVQELRADHNYAPDDAISIVAAALRRNVDEVAFNRCLDDLGPKAIEFWTPAAADRDRTAEFGFPGPVTMAAAYRRPPRVDPTPPS